MDPGLSQGIESFLRKLRVAKNKDGFSKFQKQITRHRQDLGMSLSVLGPYVSTNKDKT